MIIDNNVLETQKKERNDFLQKILISNSKKKIIIAGPGTGKTYLFEKIIEKKEGNYLILTFIKNLVNKLDEQFNKKAECKTFHKYCKELLKECEIDNFADNFILFNKLTPIVKSDYQIINSCSGNDLNFDKFFKNFFPENEYINFYLSRSIYYNSVSFDDSVYRVLIFLKKNNDKIPEYDNIFVDEYQDFCKLEVELLDILSTKSPILIVGDDDQALYEGRYSNPSFIREKFNNDDYEKFYLPYCSRCTNVVVEAFHDIVNNATNHGHLKSRVKKKFICYLPDKIVDCNNFEQIIWCDCSTHSKKYPYISKFIDLKIKEFNKNIHCFSGKADYDVLVIGPKNYLKTVSTYFLSKSEYCIFYKDKDRNDNLNKFDGYRILLSDINSLLGWRVLLEFITFKDKINFLKNNLTSSDLISLIPKDIFKQQRLLLKILEALSENDNSLSKEDIDIIEKYFKMTISQIKEKISKTNTDKIDLKVKDKINIKFSTYNGCKGLSASHVFILGLNNGVLPKDKYNIKDIEICRLLVALTRATKSCCLISTKYFSANSTYGKSIFLDWIDPKKIKEIKINKQYWDSLQVNV